jgi:hypothetical protein
MADSPTAGKKCRRPLRVLNLPLRSAEPPAATGRFRTFPPSHRSTRRCSDPSADLAQAGIAEQEAAPQVIGGSP